MSTQAKAAFDANIERATYFLDIHEKVQPGVGAPVKAHRELPRGALVFAIGALDAYLSEVSAEVIVQQLQVTTATSDIRAVLARVQREVPTLPMEVALLPSQTERVERIKDAIADHFLNNVSNHGSKAVAAILDRLGRKPKDSWNDLKSQGHGDAASRIDTWTEKRHEVVHQGKKPTIRREAARKLIKLIKAIVNEIEKHAPVP